ncbi:MAG: hypothetical protein H6577_01450 [Lewinellaceae bacterium]|nr:hypothetical protein [Saprospiraceae bacterium]MCB9336771.1 hypothetical protein [Lewinellaceae bacterium]
MITISNAGGWKRLSKNGLGRWGIKPKKAIGHWPLAKGDKKGHFRPGINPGREGCPKKHYKPKIFLEASAIISSTNSLIILSSFLVKMICET